jgi:hypothetical protein
MREASQPKKDQYSKQSASVTDQEGKKRVISSQIEINQIKAQSNQNEAWNGNQKTSNSIAPRESNPKPIANCQHPLRSKEVNNQSNRNSPQYCPY